MMYNAAIRLFEPPSGTGSTVKISPEAGALVNFTTSLLRSLLRPWRKRLRSREAMLSVIATLSALLVCVPAFSQSGVGTISRHGFRPDGRRHRRAPTVTVVFDASRGISRPYVTDSAGQYVALNLTPSTYTVRANQRLSDNRARQRARASRRKHPRGSDPDAWRATQTVTVTSEAPAVDTQPTPHWAARSPMR